MVAVSAEQFQEAFRDIGVACVQPEQMGKWDAACPRQNSKCKEGVDVDTGKDDDKDEDDLLFMAVLSSLGGMVD